MSQDPLTPQDAVRMLADRLEPVAVEAAPVGGVSGRVLAAPVLLDRDSPACDVSAMDGFAVRAAELSAGPLPVAGECRIGEAPAELSPGAALRIYTGSPTPAGADTVVRLEWVEESDGAIRLLPDKTVAAGSDIRRQGENATAGDQVLAAGVTLGAPAIAAAATVGLAEVTVYRQVKLAVITTGAELERGATGALPAWRLRDSNGPSLVAMFAPAPWVESVAWTHADDSLEAITAALSTALESADAVALTGGVSKGAYDFVPDAVRRVGGDVLFHRIRARPGQPTLGAAIGSKPIVGLPGNPLAVLTAGRRVLTPALRKLAGFAEVDPAAPVVKLEAWSGKTLPLTWWRPALLTGPGAAQLAALQGSGDVCGPAATDGFIEAPPGSDSAGPYAFYDWRP